MSEILEKNKIMNIKMKSDRSKTTIKQKKKKKKTVKTSQLSQYDRLLRNIEIHEQMWHDEEYDARKDW